MPELGTPGSGRGVLSNEHPYRDPAEANEDGTRSRNRRSRTAAFRAAICPRCAEALFVSPTAASRSRIPGSATMIRCPPST